VQESEEHIQRRKLFVVWLRVSERPEDGRFITSLPRVVMFSEINLISIVSVSE